MIVETHLYKFVIEHITMRDVEVEIEVLKMDGVYGMWRMMV